MIDYNKNNLFSSTRLMGSVLPRAVPQAMLSLLITYAIIASAPANGAGEPFYEAMFSPYCHQVSMISIGLVIAFRVNLAYNRYWEAASAVTQMRSKWWNAAISVVAFDDKWSGQPVQILGAAGAREALYFKATIIHLFSLLHAVSARHSCTPQAAMRTLQHIGDRLSPRCRSAPHRSRCLRSSSVGTSPALLTRRSRCRTRASVPSSPYFRCCRRCLAT